MGYFAALIAVSAAAGLACLFVPDESSPSGRLLRLTASLAVTAVALAPLASARERVTKLFSDFERYVASFDAPCADDALGESAGRAFSSEIAALVCGEFELPPERVRVAVTVDTSVDVPALIGVRVSIVAGDGTPDPGEVSDFVKDRTGTDCETVILAPG